MSEQTDHFSRRAELPSVEPPVGLGRPVSLHCRRLAALDEQAKLQSPRGQSFNVRADGTGSTG